MSKIINNHNSRFRWTILRKIGGLSSILILIVWGIIIYSIIALKHIRDDLQEIAKLDVPLTDVYNKIESNQLELQIAMNELLWLNKNINNLSTKKNIEIKQKLKSTKGHIDKQINQGTGLLLSHREDHPEFKAKFQKINSALITVQKESHTLHSIILEITNAIDANNYPEADIIEEMIAKNAKFDSEVINLVKAVKEFTSRRLEVVEKHEHTFLMINIFLGIIALLLSIFLSLIINGNIQNNIFRLSQKMSEVRKAITEKNLFIPASNRTFSSDEIGDLELEIYKTIKIFSKEIHQRERLSHYLKKIATTDQLTGAFNRFKWEEMLRFEILRVDRNKYSLSVLVFDIDFFKKVNDTYGHDVGDFVLIEVVKIVKQQIRVTDSIYRLGGEEFAILAPYTSSEDALTLAERIRKSIESHIFEYVTQVTISIGVTQFKVTDNPKQFLKRADLALYKSKERGRNQVNILFDS
ncbi:GGDEF domain-containing protein [Pleurocapsa sp. PCC 7319]|uniref:GGDEF domain-containing protein n=1 Tax=Pleurocapsa sp. PCC 7319 TaxID=118161 RepID=UPI00034B203A|nr:GGDEF domain-containing protein [Pleurocapsa sp. PCC 7319]